MDIDTKLRLIPEVIAMILVGYVWVEGIVYIFFFKIPMVKAQTIHRRIDVCSKERQLVEEQDKLYEEQKNLRKKKRGKNVK